MIKIKSSDFRSVCYGLSSLLAGIALLKTSGALDDITKIISKKRQIDNNTVNNILNKPTQPQDVYYKECFRNKGN